MCVCDCICVVCVIGLAVFAQVTMTYVVAPHTLSASYLAFIARLGPCTPEAMAAVKASVRVGRCCCRGGSSGVVCAADAGGAD
jgi:hypothetical protein